jgi:hypothetical protein
MADSTSTYDYFVQLQTQTGPLVCFMTCIHVVSGAPVSTKTAQSTFARATAKTSMAAAAERDQRLGPTLAAAAAVAAKRGMRQRRKCPTSQTSSR